MLIAIDELLLTEKFQLLNNYSFDINLLCNKSYI